MEFTQFYGTNIPNIDEIVSCKVIEILENSITVKLDEYNIDGFIILSEYTNRKRIRGNKKITHVGKIIYAKVDEILTENGGNNIKLSKAYLTDDDQDVIKFKQIKKSNYKLKKVINLLVKKFKYDEQKIYNDIIHVIDKERRQKKIEKNLYNYIEEDIDNFLNNFKDEEKDDIYNLFLKNNHKNNKNNSIETILKFLILYHHDLSVLFEDY